MTPDERKLELHLEGGPFLVGVAEGRWEVIRDSAIKWPNVLFRIAASVRDKSPSGYNLRANCENYPNQPPTSTFWDLEGGVELPEGKRPWGSGLVAVVFRTDWRGLQAIYHPYDRAASSSGHTEWPGKYPYWIWGPNHTIVDLLSVIYGLLNCREYHGVRCPE